MKALIRRHVRSRRFTIWAALLTASAVALAFLPLFDLLGFEFSFVLGFVASIGAADLGSTLVRRARASERAGLELAVTPGRCLAIVWLAAAATAALQLVPPLAVISLNALRVRNCDWWFGLETYLGLAVVGSLIGTSVGVLCGIVAGDRRRWSNALPYLVIIASISGAVWRFYSEPPVFAFNAFGGYFPGNLYDENIVLPAAFYWSRLWQAAVLVLLYGLVALRLDVPSLKLRWNLPRPTAPRWRSAALVVLSGAAAATLWVRSGELGFAIEAEDIQEALGGRFDTEHFTIYYPLGGPIERDIEIIARDHEFRLAQVERVLGAEASGRITSYYFPDPDTKGRLIGARYVHMAKPWRNEIYLDHQPFPHHTLRHEIAHVVAGAFSDSVFGVSVEAHMGLPIAFNVGLIEGTAVAADWPDHRGGELTPHQSVKALTQLGLAPPVDAILSPRFLTFASTRSYTTGGSFVRFILERYGADRLRALYATGGHFMLALGRSQGEVIAEWRAMIERVELPPDAAQVIEEAFRRPGIFSRTCPHAIARRQERAGQLLARGRLRDAADELRRVCADAGGEPAYLLQLATVLEQLGDHAEAERIRATIASADDVSSTLRANALLARLSTAMRHGDRQAAARLLAQAEALPVGEDLRRILAAYRLALDHDGPGGDALRRYFFGDSPRALPDLVLYMARAGAVVAAEPELGMGHYLVGRNIHHRGADREATAALTRALDFGLPHPLLVREAARMLAEAGYLAGDHAAVRRAIDILGASDQPEVYRLLAEDWRERLAWQQK